jgi:membrane fusion protein, multidrug efflux system
MVKISSLQAQVPLSGMSILEADQIDLWFQPVYQIPTGVVLHHEVFVRWRDRQGQFHLPETFFPSLARLGLLPWLDRQVIDKVVARLAQEEFLSLSINLSTASLSDRHLIEYIEQLLVRSQLEPNRLSFEITEKSVSYHFDTALQFISELKQLGCRVVLDNFSGLELDLEHYQQLSVDMVKVDSQLLHLLSSPEGEDLGQYLLDMRSIIGAIVIKFVEESPALDWIEKSGFNGVQGCYLNPPDSVPDSVSFESNKFREKADLQFDFGATDFGATVGPTSFPEILLVDPVMTSSAGDPVLINPIAIQAPVMEPPIAIRQPSSADSDSRSQKLEKPQWQFPWLRLVVGAGVVGMASLALTIGLSSIGYHFLHVVIEGGVLNGRTVRVQSPLKGDVTEFYAQPGAQVKAGQVLARIEKGREEEDALLKLEGEVQSKTSQLNAALQTQAVLQSQATSLASRSESVWDVAAQVSTTDLSGQEAAVSAAIAQANAAKLNRDRYQSLADEGAISKQTAEQYRATWEVAEANVQQARSALETARTEAAATRSRTLLSQNPGLGNGFVQESAQLQQQIQTQASLVRTLTSERDNAQQRLAQARSIFSSRRDLEVAAPFAGVVYRTERERNEQVEQSAPLLTLLDCKDLWVEIVVSAKEASQIDMSKPVKVELSSAQAAVMGEVMLNQPMSSAQGGEDQFRLTRVQALQPVIPPELAGQALVRLTIRIPPPEVQTQAQQFCGVGQLARLTFTKKMFSL